MSSGMMRGGLLGLVLIVVSGLARQAEAVPGCPFCAPSDPPFSDRLARCDAALLVKWVSLVSDEKSGTETTTFSVEQVFRATQTRFQPTDVVRWNYGRDGKPGDQFLLIGAEVEGAIEWEQPVALTGEYLFAYIRAVPPPESQDRLAFFLKFLEFPDAEIRNDAYAEFSRAQYKDVAALAPRLPREKLRTWLKSTDPQIQVRLGLYGMMLGLGGDDSDAEFLEQLIFRVPEPDKPRFGIDGMMAGYLLLRGERGLESLLKRKLADPAGEDDLIALRSALIFLWEYSRDRVPGLAIRAAMRQYLDRPNLAVSVVENLARWKDWESLDRLIMSYGKEPFDSNLSRQKIVAFALICERDGNAATDGPTDSARKARQFLQTLDPDFVQTVERTFLSSRNKSAASEKKPQGE